MTSCGAPGFRARSARLFERRQGAGEGSPGQGLAKEPKAARRFGWGGGGVLVLFRGVARGGGEGKRGRGVVCV